MMGVAAGDLTYMKRDFGVRGNCLKKLDYQSRIERSDFVV